MSENKENATRLSGLKSGYAALPAEAKGAIGFLLAFFLFLSVTIVLRPLLLERNCWELQAKEGRIFKFNACNGDVVEITEQYFKPKK